MKSIIVAQDKNRGIGAAGDLLWQRDLPADLRHFKDVTMGGTIIMGRKTYESIGRPLPGRQNIVVSRSWQSDDVLVVDSLERAYQAAEHDVFVIGGGEIYAAAIDDVDRLYVTEVDASFDSATVFFPAIDPAVWQEISRETHMADQANRYNYAFVAYQRR